MVDMKHSPSTSALGVAFNAFLFADVAVLGGAPVTVLSALARLDVDPWQEAADLARLPRKAASQRLTELLMRLPHRQGDLAEAHAISTRLIGLLPAADLNGAQPALGKSPRRSDQLFAVVGLGLGLVVLASVLLSANSHTPAPVKPEQAHSVVSASPPETHAGPPAV